MTVKARYHTTLVSQKSPPTPKGVLRPKLTVQHRYLTGLTLPMVINNQPTKAPKQEQEGKRPRITATDRNEEPNACSNPFRSKTPSMEVFLKYIHVTDRPTKVTLYFSSWSFLGSHYSGILLLIISFAGGCFQCLLQSLLRRMDRYPSNEIETSSKILPARSLWSLERRRSTKTISVTS